MLRHWNHIRSRVHHRSVPIQSRRSTESTVLGVPVRALLYLAKTGMCCRTGYGFQDLESRTYKGVGWRGWGVVATLHKVFLIFSLDDKTSALEVFCSCSFILRAHFETSLLMVSYYGCEI